MIVQSLHFAFDSDGFLHRIDSLLSSSAAELHASRFGVDARKKAVSITGQCGFSKDPAAFSLTKSSCRAIICLLQTIKIYSTIRLHSRLPPAKRIRLQLYS